MSETETPHTATAEPGHGQTHEGADAPRTSLGPIDVTSWAYAGAGSLLGVLTILALYVAQGA